jgi:hypothetical protein
MVHAFLETWAADNAATLECWDNAGEFDLYVSVAAKNSNKTTTGVDFKFSHNISDLTKDWREYFELIRSVMAIDRLPLNGYLRIWPG